MTNDKIENWNQLLNVKYRFWQEAIHINKKVISIFVDLEINYNDRENPHIIINTEVVIKDKGEIGALQEPIVRLNNLFRLDNLSYYHLYLLPLEDKMIKIALRYAEKKIGEYLKVEGENL